MPYRCASTMGSVTMGDGSVSALPRWCRYATSGRRTHAGGPVFASRIHMSQSSVRRRDVSKSPTTVSRSERTMTLEAPDGSVLSEDNMAMASVGDKRGTAAKEPKPLVHVHLAGVHPAAAGLGGGGQLAHELVRRPSVVIVEEGCPCAAALPGCRCSAQR